MSIISCGNPQQLAHMLHCHAQMEMVGHKILASLLASYRYVCIKRIVVKWLFVTYLGTADRHCDISGKWQQSNTTNCSSTVYADLAEQVGVR